MIDMWVLILPFVSPNEMTFFIFRDKAILFLICWYICSDSISRAFSFSISFRYLDISSVTDLSVAVIFFS